MDNNNSISKRMEDYLDGNLTPEERKEFEKLIDESEEIRDEVALTRRIITGIEGYGFQEMLKKIHSEYLRESGEGDTL